MFGSYYVVGGQFRAKPYEIEWQLYGKAVIAQVNGDTGEVKLVVEYFTPENARSLDQYPSIIFNAGTRVNNQLYVCTQTEIIVYKLPTFEPVGYVSHPYFNDVHHVLPIDGKRLLVANTGLDMVLELDLSGKVIKEWSVLNDDPWLKFSRDIDYRKIPSTKPHKAHPNYLFRLNSDLWVTRFIQKDAICLNKPELRFKIGVGGPHDGVLSGGRLYFTTVNGHIVIFDAQNGKLIENVDLNAIDPGPKPLGWCRGLKVIDDNRIIVGFSRLRQTKQKANIRWVKKLVGRDKPLGNAPTRIAAYDLERRKLLWQVNLEEVGMDAVFSIHEGELMFGTPEVGKTD